MSEELDDLGLTIAHSWDTPVPVWEPWEPPQRHQQQHQHQQQHAGAMAAAAAAAAAALAAAKEQRGQRMGAPPPAPLEEPPRLPGSDDDDDDDDGDPPPTLCCPFTLALLRDPVLLVNDTHTYERTALKTWFEGQRERGKALRSPTTGAVITGKAKWVTNQTAKALILEWEEQRVRKG